MLESLTGQQRAALMKQAHHRAPVARVGKHGLTPQLASHVDRELAQHELIKLRFSDFKEVRRDITRQLAADLGAVLVSVIGNVGILFRQADDPAARHVEFPR